ncbi:M48 family metallopeptidase [Rugamonas sp.]|uniref:M48 family metallopeptidase n=1 Tax=Rugamonas sp. TaxID=1926287 RepID=UPI0025E9CADA|nr:M48 family metallopeptidase [Rugamonas sp.]
MLIMSVLAWSALAAITGGLALAVLLLLMGVYAYAQSAFVAHLQGTGVNITHQQFPDLMARIDTACRRLGVEVAPPAYLLQGDSLFSRTATRFPGRQFIVLRSELIDALETQPDAINFYIGHEVGRIKQRYLRWSALFLPASVIPLLGAAYCRARIYSCDRHGFHACDHLDGAQIGLAALAAGGRRWRGLSAAEYARQARGASGFWMSFHELLADRPWLVKRMAVVQALARGAAGAPPARHGMAYVLALCVPRLGAAGGVGGAALVLALLGLLSAYGRPAYAAYQQRAQLARAVGVGRDASAVVERYFYANGKSPATLEQAGFALADPGHAVQQVDVDPGDGVVRVQPSDLALRGKTIAFTPRLDENKKIMWRCGSDDIPARQLPPDCRGR